MTVGRFLTQVSGLQFIDGFNWFYKVFVVIVSFKRDVWSRQAAEDEAFLSHEEEEEEKGRLKKREIGFFDS